MKPLPLRRTPRRRGVALVIVLALVVLLAAASVGFFASTSGLRQGAHREAAGTTTRSLADIAVNLVQGQIDHATTRGDGSVWASQPGAIRLYKNDGDLERIYRLYSSTAMTTDDPADLAADLPGTGWASPSALWVDLNAPDVTRAGTASEDKRFPILDPRSPSNLTSVLTMEGFAIDTSKVPLPSSTPAKQVPSVAPMPVRWLYVLQDGKLVAPASGGGGVTVTGASEKNPIVGRIAFWADDETCRVNINTAAGAAETLGADAIFWDTPRFDAGGERNFAAFPPVSGEFQRYPGHPATTTLGKVFPALSSQQLMDLTPRYVNAGSMGGTTLSASAITPKTDRLYSSVGEMLYDSTRASGSLTAQQLESAKFMLTAHSRSPELNLYGKPRISMWPVRDATSLRTTVDQKLADAATVAGNAFYFTRTDPDSPVTDIGISRNNSLLNYLDKLTQTSVPGFGGTFSSKYGGNCEDILVKMFDYIRCTNLNDPLNSAFAYAPQGVVVPAKHGTWNAMGMGRFPVISEISFWFVALGRGDDTSTPSADPVPMHPSQQGTRQNETLPTEWVSLTEPAAGRVAVQVYVLLSLFDPAQGWTAITRDGPGFLVTGLQGLSLTSGTSTYNLGMTSPSFVYFRAGPGAAGNGRSWGGVRSFRDGLLLPADPPTRPEATDLPLGAYSPPSSVSTPVDAYALYSDIISLPVGGTMTLSANANVVISAYGGSGPNTLNNNLVTTYTIPLTDITGVNMPVPTLSGGALNSVGLPWTVSNNDKASAVGNDRAYMSLLLDAPTFSHFSQIVSTGNDVLWSLVPNGTGIRGDYRLLARKEVDPTTIGQTYFAKHPGVGAGNHMAYSSPLWNAYLPGATLGGNLVSGAGYWQLPPGSSIAGGFGLGSQPYLPSGIDGVVAPGDWDNGFGVVPDGPYINKADEGSINGLAGGYNPYFTDNYYAEQLSLGATYFFPNRLVPSPVMFGSLPTGVISSNPWRTLLFRPGPANHVGADEPKDHLLLDLFWMPTAVPYAISEPFSTDGKVNMNYRIEPFTYITRNTALRSVLDTVKMAKVNLSQANVYKRHSTSSTGSIAGSVRTQLNLDEVQGTLRQFEERFDDKKLFLSASEICDIYLVPEGESWSSDSSAQSIWYGAQYAMVGDNTREKPYADLYSRLTTRSNTFTVYYTVQALRNPPSQDPATWEESKGEIMGEQRGSTTIERYIDPNDTDLTVDYASSASDVTLEDHYRWRIIGNRRFTK